MGRDDWYRRTTWTESDRGDFWARIAKTRKPASQAQYIRIQASVLQESGLIDAAIDLDRRLLAEFPEPFELAVTHYELGKCLLTKGDIDGALDSFRNAITAQRDLPTVQTKAWLAFGRLVAETGRKDLYDEFLTYFGERESQRAFASELSFPIDRYELAATLAIIHRDLGNQKKAVEFAREALAAASAQESGFRYHPNIGLVENTSSALHKNVIELAQHKG